MEEREEGMSSGSAGAFVLSYASVRIRNLNIYLLFQTVSNYQQNFNMYSIIVFGTFI